MDAFLYGFPLYVTFYDVQIIVYLEVHNTVMICENKVLWVLHNCSKERLHILLQCRWVTLEVLRCLGTVKARVSVCQNNAHTKPNGQPISHQEMVLSFEKHNFNVLIIMSAVIAQSNLFTSVWRRKRHTAYAFPMDHSTEIRRADMILLIFFIMPVALLPVYGAMRWSHSQLQ